MQNVNQFKDENKFLSNFYPAPVIFEGVEYPTVEHAYQAAQTVVPEEREIVAAQSTAARAERAGRSVHVRPGWTLVKAKIMTELVHRKFTTHPHLARRLLDTGNAKLIKGGKRDDTFWGVYEGEGQNVLGKILMNVRADLRKLDSKTFTI